MTSVQPAASFEPGRLTVAREVRGYSKAQLAELVELSARRIGDYERRGAAPSERTLGRLVGVLEFPRAFFSMSPPEQPQAVSFRSQSRMKAATRKQAIATAALAAEFDQWLRKHFRFDHNTLPTDLAGMDPIVAAAAFRNYCSLGIGPAPNLVHLAELLGVRVLGVSLAAPGLDAFSFWVGTRPFILVNWSGTAERLRWNLAHELGHLIMHQGGHYLPTDRGREDEADVFASELLLPLEGLRLWGALANDLRSIQENKKIWRVSAMAYMRRMKELGYLSEWQYRSLAIEATSINLRTVEDDINRDASPTLAAVMRKLSEAGLTIGSASSDLGIGRPDLAQFVHGLAPVALQGMDRDAHPLDSGGSRPHLSVIPGAIG